MSITVEDMLSAYALAYDTWLDPESERENPTPEYARLIRHVVEHEYANLQAENAKLRELVRDMWNGMCGYEHDCRYCEHYELYEGQRLVGECQYHARMRELGVEI